MRWSWLAVVCLAFAAHAHALVIGVYELSPHMVVDTQKEPRGAVVDFVQEVLVKSGEFPVVEWRVANFARMLRELETEQIDMVFMVARNEQRQKLFRYSSQPFFDTRSAVVVSKSGKLATLTSLEQLRQMRVGDISARHRGCDDSGAVAWLQRATHRPAVWVQASAIGFYGVRPPHEVLTETSAAGGGFMSELCVRWEAAAAKAQALGVRQVVLRLGVVLGPGGALPPLLLPIRLGVGGRMGSGQQVMSWIHRDDVLALIHAALRDPQMHGIYNATAPRSKPNGKGKVSKQVVFTYTGSLPTPRWLPADSAHVACNLLLRAPRT